MHEKSRFYSKTQLLTNGCLVWTGGKGSQGYGTFWMYGKTVRAHRAVFLLDGVKIPKGKVVCHRCDNPSCVKRSHLWFGSYSQNTLDSIKKERWKHTGYWIRVRMAGEDHPRHKLTEANVKVIRKEAGNVRYRVLAERFGVSVPTICDVVKQRSWSKKAA